jgi:hypothetical protein
LRLRLTVEGLIRLKGVSRRVPTQPQQMPAPNQPLGSLRPCFRRTAAIHTLNLSRAPILVATCRSTPVMKLIGFTITFCWFLLTIDALPLDLEEDCVTQPCNDDAKLGKRKVDYDPITKYSVQWFINNANPAKRPKPATCLFYTRGLSRTAYTYAKTKAQSPMTTIWVRQ